MSDFIQSIEQTIVEKALFREGQTIIVAVSGGPDSMALLHLLHRLTQAHRWKLVAAHFNHQLRGRSSDADERFVRRAARRLGIPFVAGRGDVMRFARESKTSVEVAAREMRHEFLARAARQKKASMIALGHHADDQVELFFLRLLRGAGGQGLAGMKWLSPSPADSKIRLARPLLGCSRKDLEQFVREEKIHYREDSTNAELDFLRNRLRHELLPLLVEKYQPALSRSILRLMEVLSGESEFVTQCAKDWLEQRKPGFDKLPVAVQRGAVQLQLFGQGLKVDFDLIEHLRLRPGVPLTLSPGVTVCRDTDGAMKVGKIAEAKFDQTRLELRLGEGEEGDQSPMSKVQSPKSKVQSRPPHAAPHTLHSPRSTPPAAFGGLEITWQIVPHRGAVGRWGVRGLNAPKRSSALRKADSGKGRVSGRATAAKKSEGCEVFDADKVGATIALRHWQPGDRFQPIGMSASVKLQDLFSNLKIPRPERHQLVVAVTASGEVFWVEGLRMSERFKLDAGTVRRLNWCWQAS